MNLKTSLIALATITIIAVVTFISFSKSSNNLKLVPKHSNFVSIVDVFSILKKGNFSELPDLKMFRTFKKELKKESKELSKIINDLIENPIKSGIKFNSDLAIFLINEENDERFMCFSIDLLSSDNFESFIEDLVDIDELNYDLEQETDFSYFLIENQFIIGFDHQKAILINALNRDSQENLEYIVDDLFTQKQENQISSNENFKQFLNDKKDISVWMSSNMISDLGELEDLDELEEIIDKIEIEDNYVSLFFSFEQDKLSLSLQFDPNQEMDKFFSENKIWKSSFDSKVLKFIPATTYGAASVSLDFELIYSLLKESINEDVFAKSSKEFEEITNNEITLEEFSEILNGNFVFSMHDFKKIEYQGFEWGYGFKEETAEMYSDKYTISLAQGTFSEEEKRILNQGGTIKAYSSGRTYCINIQNVLDQGYDLDYAINNDSKINWFKTGCWGYDKFEKTKNETLPMVTFAFDLNKNKSFKTVIELMVESGDLIKSGDYYEFRLDGEFPTYLIYDEKYGIVTNDKESITSFDQSLMESKISASFLKSDFYLYSDLNYDNYPKIIKKEIKENANEEENDLLEMFTDLSNSCEVKKYGNKLEITYNLKAEDKNSLNTLITKINDNHKWIMSL
jgi:hypothetical protein